MADHHVPGHLGYTLEHGWVQASAPEGEGPAVVRVGVTSYAQAELGDIVVVTLPAPGEVVRAGERCGEIESTRSVSDLYAPVDGTVVARNDALEGSPELVNADPYGEGWLIAIAPLAPAAPAALLDAEAYRAAVQGATRSAGRVAPRRERGHGH